MSISKDELNRLRDLILAELGKVDIVPDENSPAFIWGTEGEHPITRVSYAGAIIISMDEKLTQDFYQNFRAWLLSKGLPPPHDLI